MAQFVVRNIENSMEERLQQRAKRHGHSMEEEVRDILRNVFEEDETPGGGLGSEIAKLFSRVGLTSDISELHGQEIEPISFEP